MDEPRRGRGRPRRVDGTASNVTFRASEQERALWEAAAAAEGLALADWIRAACDARAARRG